MARTRSPSRRAPHRETGAARGALRLAILKENLRYRDVFRKYAIGLEREYGYLEECWGLTLAEIEEYHLHRRGTKDEVRLVSSRFFLECFDIGVPFMVGDPFWIRGDGAPLLTAKETLSFLDPDQNVESSVPASKRNYVLGRLFYDPGIEVLPLDNRFYIGWKRIFHTLRHRSKQHEALFSALPQSADDLRDAADEEFCPTLGIGPDERVLMVDLRKTRGQLIREFKEFLDGAPLDTTRERKETEKHLEVWRMVRRRGMAFKEIARELRMTVNAVELSFRRAYEITQGTLCPPGELARLRTVQKSSLVKLCSTCPDRVTCTELCEPIKRYADQDQRTARELSIPHPETSDIRPNRLTRSRVPLKHPSE